MNPSKNTALEPRPVPLGYFRRAFRIGDQHRRQCSAFGRSAKVSHKCFKHLAMAVLLGIGMIVAPDLGYARLMSPYGEPSPSGKYSAVVRDQHLCIYMTIGELGKLVSSTFMPGIMEVVCWMPDKNIVILSKKSSNAPSAFCACSLDSQGNPVPVPMTQKMFGLATWESHQDR